MLIIYVLNKKTVKILFSDNIRNYIHKYKYKPNWLKNYLTTLFALSQLLSGLAINLALL